jgi:predicted DsbA family dithiol-disulfide isomerase
MQHDLAERLLDAHFTRGIDVADRAQLAMLAREVGLGAARATEFLSSGEGVAETRAAIGEAREIGVTAVPTFVFDGKHAIAGAQPASVFLKALEEVAAESPSAVSRQPSAQS